jgi:hypothetical protein
MARKRRMAAWLIPLLLVVVAAALFIRTRGMRTSTVAAVDNEAIAAIVSSLCRARNNAILAGDEEILKRLYNTDVQNGRYAYDHELRKLKYLANWSEKQHVRFTAIDHQLVIRWAREGGSGYTVNFLLSTAYTYAYLDRPEVTNTMRIGTYHEMVLTVKNEAWVISREWYTDPFADSLDLEKLTDMEIENTILSNEARDFSTLNERRVRAVAYADRYVGAADSGENSFSYNKKYKDYNNVGGDCANFISQVLHEGGGFKKTGTWTYHKDGSMAWVKAQNLRDYMLYSGRASLLAQGSYGAVLKRSYQLLPGDLVAYEKKGRIAHVSVVTGADSRGYSLVNCHNTDRYRVPWDLGWSNTGIRFHFIRVHY